MPDYSRSPEFLDVTLLLQATVPPKAPARCRSMAAGFERSRRRRSTERRHDGLKAARSSSAPIAPTARFLRARLARLWMQSSATWRRCACCPARPPILPCPGGGDARVCLDHSGLLVVDAATLHDVIAVPSRVRLGGATALAFSPDGALAVGCSSGAIEIRSAGGGWDLMGVCTGHAGWVGSIDWSESGSCYSRTVPMASCLLGRAWCRTRAVCRCPLHVVNRLVPAPVGDDGHRGLVGGSPRYLIEALHAGGAVAVAARDGSITLVGYPCVGSAAASRRYAELRDSVDSLAWSADDGVLLSMSASGELFQLHIGAEPRPWRSAAAAAAVEEAAYDSDIEHELVAPSAPGDTRDAESAELAATVKTGWANDPSIKDGSSVLASTARVGGQFTELHAPSDWRDAVDSYDAPPDGLSLEWVYGCRGHDAHGSVHWTASGEVAFHAASIGVTFDPKGRTQRFFTGHSQTCYAQPSTQMD